MIYINKYIIKPTSSFENDLQKLYKYIAFNLKEPLTAKKFYSKVIKQIYSLQYYPEKYIKISNCKNKSRNLRRLLIDKYVIIYEVNNSTRTSFYSTYISRKSKLFKSIINSLLLIPNILLII